MNANQPKYAFDGSIKSSKENLTFLLFLRDSLEWAQWALSPFLIVFTVLFVCTIARRKKRCAKGFVSIEDKAEENNKKSLRQREVLAHVMEKFSS
jgi:hypothetical protein